MILFMWIITLLYFQIYSIQNYRFEDYVTKKCMNQSMCEITYRQNFQLTTVNCSLLPIGLKQIRLSNPVDFPIMNLECNRNSSLKAIISDNNIVLNTCTHGLRIFTMDFNFDSNSIAKPHQADFRHCLEIFCKYSSKKSTSVNCFNLSISNIDITIPNDCIISNRQNLLFYITDLYLYKNNITHLYKNAFLDQLHNLITLNIGLNPIKVIETNLLQNVKLAVIIFAENINNVNFSRMFNTIPNLHSIQYGQDYQYVLWRNCNLSLNQTINISYNNLCIWFRINSYILIIIFIFLVILIIFKN